MAKKISKKSSIYVWEATTARGERVVGEFTGTSLALAKANIRSQGLVLQNIRKKSKKIDKRGTKIKPVDIMIFTRQMCTMLNAGIPLVQAFDIVSKSLTNIAMADLVLTLKSYIEEGNTFAQALEKFPQYFSTLFCNLIRAGEQSGALEIMLDRVATHQEKMASIKGKIKKALIYPVVILSFAFIVTTALLVFIVPQFQSLFSGFGADLPVLTQWVIGLSQFFQTYWSVVSFFIAVTISSVISARKKSVRFALFFDRCLLRLPVVGEICKNAIYARFARTLGVTFAAGLPLVEALGLVAYAMGNLAYTQTILQIRDEVATGKHLQETMKKSNIFPNMMLQMVGIGEESGSLEKMLNKVAAFYEEKVELAVDSLSILLEPFILLFLAAIIGVLVVAMYLPIIKLGSAV